MSCPECPHCRALGRTEHGLSVRGNLLITPTRRVPLPRRYAKFIRSLVDAYPRSVSQSDLIYAVWVESGDEEPRDPQNSLHAIAARTRAVLRIDGVTLHSQRGCGYRLVMIANLAVQREADGFNGRVKKA